MTLIGMLAGGVFALLGAWHLYWAFGGRLGLEAAIPQVHGRPAFRPGRSATVLVALALWGCAALVLSLAMSGADSRPVLRITLADILAAGLLLRAVGDFRLVGFFKRRRQTGSFARWDTWVYSPLCVALCIATAGVATAR